jgi:heme/copper-type cytochrome/quinol oxidase subunit 2
MGMSSTARVTRNPAGFELASTLGRSGLVAVCLFMAVPGEGARAEEPTEIAVSIKDHLFSPSEIHVPAGKAVMLKITNEDPTPEEFDSTALRVEKVIAAGRYVTIRLRPLAPGQYSFVGEYHSDTAKGIVVSE